MTNIPSTVEEIQQQMRQVRTELGNGVEELVANAQDVKSWAREVTDWRHYVRNYPWACLGAAAAVGYLMVPSRSQVVVADTLLSGLKNGKPKASGGMVKSLVNMAAGALLQGGLAVLTQKLNQTLAQVMSPQVSPIHEWPKKEADAS